MNLSLGETSQTSKTFWNFINREHFVNLQNKVHFTCSLDINSHYREYLTLLKAVKMKRMLLTKFDRRLNQNQIEKIKKEIERSEELLNQFVNSDSSNLKNEIPMEVKEMSFVNKEEKKLQEIIKSEHQIMNNLTKKGIIKDRSSLSMLPSRRVLAINKKTGEITGVLPKNIVSRLQLQSSRCQAVMDPLKFVNKQKKERIESNSIICKSLDLKSESVMALKVPLEEIVENNHVTDMKSEI